jgi:hypothetical protein
MSNVMLSRVLVIALVIAGCQTAPVPITANQSCDLAPNVWKQVETPSNRDVLLGLPEQTMKKPVRESFRATGVMREAWFEDSKSNLQACLYNPSNRMSCYGGELHLIVFTRHESSWEAGPTMQVSCID